MIGLGTTFNGVEDHIFLKHTVLPEGGGARLENVQPFQSHGLKEFSPEGFEIRPITEASRSDTNQFPALGQKPADQCHKARVQVARLNSNLV